MDLPERLEKYARDLLPRGRDVPPTLVAVGGQDAVVVDLSLPDPGLRREAAFRAGVLLGLGGFRMEGAAFVSSGWVAPADGVRPSEHPEKQEALLLHWSDGQARGVRLFRVLRTPDGPVLEPWEVPGPPERTEGVLDDFLAGFRLARLGEGNGTG